MYLIIDGGKTDSREALHDMLSESLKLPQWYGRNLDALHDCLTDIREPLDIIIIREKELEENLGAYAAALRGALSASADENPHITLYTAVRAL